ncbi:MAG: hypothetical protein ABIN23_05720 [candidate division WOR-3 bacterium]
MKKNKEKINKLLNYSWWREVNKSLRREVGNRKALKNALNSLSKTLFKNISHLLYINFGFIHPEVMKIFQLWEPKNIFSYYKNNSHESGKLGKLLKNQFKLMRECDVYFYKIIKEKEEFEIRKGEKLNFVIEKINEKGNSTKKKDIETIRGNLIKLFKCSYKSYYLTIYYGETFVMDTLLIFEKNTNENSVNQVILYLKGALQYLAGYLMHQVSMIYALRSAVAAIMARNMSHNIGSHVLNYLSNPEELDNLWVI